MLFLTSTYFVCSFHTFPDIHEMPEYYSTSMYVLIFGTDGRSLNASLQVVTLQVVS